MVITILTVEIIINKYKLCTPTLFLFVQKLRYVRPENLKGVPPCINALATTQYLNRRYVREALHIPSKLPKWEVCRY